jgi:hypothetical protein
MNSTPDTQASGITPISRDDAAEISSGMMKLPTGPAVPTVGKLDTGWTWGTVTDLPPSEGVGVVIHF